MHPETGVLLAMSPPVAGTEASAPYQEHKQGQQGSSGCDISALAVTAVAVNAHAVAVSRCSSRQLCWYSRAPTDSSHSDTGETHHCQKQQQQQQQQRQDQEHEHEHEQQEQQESRAIATLQLIRTDSIGPLSSGCSAVVLGGRQHHDAVAAAADGSLLLLRSPPGATDGAPHDHDVNNAVIRKNVRHQDRPMWHCSACVAVAAAPPPPPLLLLLYIIAQCPLCLTWRTHTHSHTLT
jgi:hypothetical protein